MRNLLILLLLLCSWPAAAQERSLKVFQLNNRPAEATVEMVRPLLSAQGTVVADGRLNKLVVHDTPEVLRQVEALLAEIDLPAPQVRIAVDMSGVSPVSGHQVGVGVSGPTDALVVTGQAQATSGTSRATSSQHLLVMSGERGVIRVGQDLVDVQPYWTYAHNYGLLPPQVVFRQVSTGFAVEPTVVGDVVRLRITPWMGYLGAEGRGEILVSEASTTVALRSGESAVIGSGEFTETRKAEAYGLILGTGSRSAGSSASIRVTPTILKE